MKILSILLVGWLGYQLGKNDWRVRSSLTVTAVLLAVIFHTGVQIVLPHAAIERVASGAAWSLILVPIALLETIGIWLPVLLVPWAGGRTRIMMSGYVMVAAIQGALVYYRPFDVVIMNGEKLGPTHPSYEFELIFALVFAIPPFAFALAKKRRVYGNRSSAVSFWANA